MISASNVNTFLDHLCQVYARLLAIDEATGYGLGEPESTNLAAGAASGLLSAVLATGDVDVIGRMLRVTQGYAAGMSAAKIACNKAVLNSIERLIGTAGISGVNRLDDFLTYYNSGLGGVLTALQSPYFRELYRAWKGTYPLARNLYFEVLAGGQFGGESFGNGLRKLEIGGSQTAGASISASYLGGFAHIRVEGFTGTEDTVTVTGTQSDRFGTRTAGVTWEATVDNDGVFALTQGTATEDIIVAVSDISAGAGILTGTIIAEAHKPDGRLAIPF